MQASKRNAVSSAMVARQSLNDEELVGDWLGDYWETRNVGGIQLLDGNGGNIYCKIIFICPALCVLRVGQPTHLGSQQKVDLIL